MKPAAKKHALTVLAAPELTVQKDGVKKLQSAAVVQCAAVNQMESKAAMGAVLAGLTLHRVKASMPHGKFGAWVEQISTSGGNLPAVKKSQANNYMRLALAFVERTRVQKPDLLALPGDQTALELGDSATTRRFMGKLQGFVGECSLNELLIKHGIKGVGLKTALEQAEGADPSTGSGQGIEDFFGEVAERVYGLRQIVTSRESLLRLSPKQLDTLRDALADAHAQFEKLYAEARGTKKSEWLKS